MHAERRERLQRFAEWVAQHVTGDEKGQAQIFLDRLFQGFGQKGVLEVGGEPEFRVRKSKEDGGGTSFADLVGKPWVLIEMKRRGEDLSRHYRQAFDYWTRLVPGRPRYVVLCNFDELWVRPRCRRNAAGSRREPSGDADSPHSDYARWTQGRRNINQGARKMITKTGARILQSCTA